MLPVFAARTAGLVLGVHDERLTLADGTVFYSDELRRKTAAITRALKSVVRAPSAGRPVRAALRAVSVPAGLGSRDGGPSLAFGSFLLLPTLSESDTLVRLTLALPDRIASRIAAVVRAVDAFDRSLEEANLAFALDANLAHDSFSSRAGRVRGPAIRMLTDRLAGRQGGYR